MHGIDMAAWEIRQKELMDELKAMEDSWGKLYQEQKESKIPAGKGKAMLLLALQIKQRWQEFITKRDRGQIVKDHIPNHMVMVDWKIFEAHVACARDYLEADAYRDTLKHTQKALDLSDAHGGAWMECVVMNVLNYEKEAWIGLDEESNYLDTATRRAEGMAQLAAVPRDEVVRAFCEVATVQIELDDHQAAIKTARAAVRVEGVRPASRNTARMKLGVALGCAKLTDEALQLLEQCERDWTMSVEGTRWNEQEMVASKALLDKCLEELRRGQANETADTEILMSVEYGNMTETWNKLYQQEGPNGEALLALALRIKQRTTEELDDINWRERPPLFDMAREYLMYADRSVFTSHTRCACNCVDAGAYNATLRHTKCAIELNDAWEDRWREKVVIIVLDCELRALNALGEHSKFLDVATRRANALAEFPNVSGHDRVDALCEVATALMDRGDYAGAAAISRKALAVDAPRVSRQCARFKLGTALMADPQRLKLESALMADPYRKKILSESDRDLDEALRELERCDREWTTADLSDTTWDAEQLAQLRKCLDNNLRLCRRRLAEKQLAETLREDEQLLHPSMNHVMKGDFDKSAESAERTASLLLSGMCNSPGLARFKTSNLPSCQARAFTLTNCFLLDDHRAAGWLGAVQQAVELCEREPLEDACPICLQQLAWPAELEVGTRVTVHGLKKATHRNGDQGVVERLSVGPDQRVQVRFCKNAEPEEGMLTIEEHKAVLRGLLEQVDKPCPNACPEEVRRAAEASLSAGIGCLESKQDAVDEVLKDMLIGDKYEISTLEDIISLAQATSFPDLRRSITNEIARLEASSAYSLRVRPANLKASKGYIDASRRAFMTNCLHCFHARCIKRFVDETFHEGQQICPVCGEELEFAETLVMCAQMPSWDRPSYVD